MDDAARRLAVLLDEQPLWLDAMTELLKRMDVETVGKTTHPVRALELVERHSPDVFIVSVRASDPDLDALECVRRVAESYPNVKRVILSQSSDSADIHAAFAAGANVYCLKTSHPDDLASAIRQIFETSIYFIETFRQRAKATGPTPQTSRTRRARRTASGSAGDTPELTERELEILRLVADGYSNSQLAGMLWLSEQTVKFHLSNVYRKLKVTNRTEAARWAQLHNLLPLPGEPESTQLVAGKGGETVDESVR
jgi:DNA-binding NarL/FixJ family response regulator